MVKTAGAGNYTTSQMMYMLRICQSIVPLGKTEWGRVALQYNLTKSKKWCECDAASLRRKFKELEGKRKPTGDALMPEHIRLAKDVKRQVDMGAVIEEPDDGADIDAGEPERRSVNRGGYRLECWC